MKKIQLEISFLSQKQSRIIRTMPNVFSGVNGIIKEIIYLIFFCFFSYNYFKHECNERPFYCKYDSVKSWVCNLNANYLLFSWKHSLCWLVSINCKRFPWSALNKKSWKRLKHIQMQNKETRVAISNLVLKWTSGSKRFFRFFS